MCRIIGQKLMFLILLHHFCAYSSSSSDQFGQINPASNTIVSCDFYSTINVTNGSLQIDKSWLHNGLRYNLGLYGKYDYILSDDRNKILVPEHVRGCICLIKPCINACCEPSQMTDKETGNCVSENFNQLWWNVGTEGKNLVKTEVSKIFQWIHRRPTCRDLHFLDPDEHNYDEWYLAENGSIYVPDDESFLDNGHHCVAIDRQRQVLLVLGCMEPSKNDKRFQILGTVMLLSVPCLLATFIVYAVIPELRDVRGMSIMSYVGGLAVGYTFLATVQIIGSRDECHNGSAECYNPTFCTFSGYIIYFSFMLSFFWLNAMCFDIFWTFRGVRSNSRARKNFVYYCIYAWGMASFLTVLVLSLDLSNLSEEYKPGMYYTQTCFLQHNKTVEFLYLYMILLILVCINITFFGVTSHRIRKRQSETAAVVAAGNSGRHSKQNDDNYGFMLYLRLFIIMGVTWSMELLSWFISHDSPWFYFTDILNCLQGVLIFLIVVCNDKVRKLVVKRFYRFRGFTPPKTGTTFYDTCSSQVSSSYYQNNSSIPLEQQNVLLEIKDKDMNCKNV